MINRTNGIVLRVSPFSKTSHVVTWLTPDYGKITTIVKGALRPKSAFLGQYDLFYSCDLLFYARERNGTHVLRECSPVNTRSALRTDWRAAACASYICDLVTRMSVTGDGSTALCDLLETALDSLAAGTSGVAFLLWFELRAAEAIGFSPRLTECPGCKRGLSSGEDSVEFSAASGGLLCRSCAEGHAEATIPVDSEVLLILQAMQSSAAPAALASLPSGARHMDNISRILGLFLEYHVHPPMAARLIAAEIAT